MDNAFRGVARKKRVTIEDLICNGTYAILRKCPSAHLAFGKESIWKIKVTQFYWLLENLNEEFKPQKK